jgi:hypothetical protein
MTENEKKNSVPEKAKKVSLKVTSLMPARALQRVSTRPTPRVSTRPTPRVTNRTSTRTSTRTVE